MVNVEKYNFPQTVLHWVSAVLVVFLLMIGSLVLSELPNTDPNKITSLKGHMILGFLALLLTVTRIVWRKKSTQPAAVKTGSTFLDKSAGMAHIALNLIVLFVSMSGIGIALQAGLGEIVFLGNGLLPVNFFEFPARITHGLLTKVLLGLVLLHVIAALYHQFIIKDGLFKRISLFKG